MITIVKPGQLRLYNEGLATVMYLVLAGDGEFDDMWWVIATGFAKMCDIHLCAGWWLAGLDIYCYDN